MATKTNDLTNQIGIRVSEHMKEQIFLRAMEKGMNIAEYVRWLIMKDLEEKTS